jgi:hypothetical protein
MFSMDINGIGGSCEGLLCNVSLIRFEGLQYYGKLRVKLLPMPTVSTQKQGKSGNRCDQAKEL